ncbi:MAG: hypothetical protein QGH63_03380, partial [Rhodospirillales bacterium]|nr:hypothetical protein [Rhodospirillales bacterium]
KIMRLAKMISFERIGVRLCSSSMSEFSLIFLVSSTFCGVLVIMPDFIDQTQGLSRNLAVKKWFL